MANDPVCGMHVEEESAGIRVEYEGRTYFFCSPGCRDRFQEDPAKFAARSGSEET